MVDKYQHVLKSMLQSLRAGGPDRGMQVRVGVMLSLLGCDVADLQAKLRNQKAETLAAEILAEWFPGEMVDGEVPEMDEPVGDAGFEDPEENETVDAPVVSEFENDFSEESRPGDANPLEVLGLAPKVNESLLIAGIFTVGDVRASAPFVGIKGVGTATAQQIKSALEAYDLSEAAEEETEEEEVSDEEE